MKLYRYTMLKQDGEKIELGVSKKKNLAELYALLDCGTVEIIPSDYYNRMGYGRCTMWGDEEARYKTTNTRNPFFRVIEDFYGNEWDVVGNILMEKRATQGAQ